MNRLKYFLATLSVLPFSISHPASAADTLKVNQGDKIVIIGNNTAEHLQYSNDFETLLQTRFAGKDPTVRNLGWSGDTITQRLRSQDFQDHGHTLIDHQPNVILAFFGFNESFAGPEGVPQFETDLTQFLKDLLQLKYPSQTYHVGAVTPVNQDKSGEVRVAPRIILFSPIANEDLNDRNVPAATLNNANLKLYSQSMKKIAAENGVTFIDLFTPTLALLEDPKTNLTTNGIHLSDEGNAELAKILDAQLFGEELNADSALIARVKAEVAEKNKQFFYDYRAVNGYYIYGGRKHPFGVINFPDEFAKLRAMTSLRDARVWQVAQDQEVSREIDDSKTGELLAIESNFTKEITITSPEDAKELFTLPEGFEINLYASEVEFPDLENPVSFTFDSAGRLWVTTNSSYPQYLPGEPVNDKLLIFTDVDGDGKADKRDIFAENLYLPIGVELGDGGAYVSQQPNLVFLKDTDGDGRSDSVTQILNGLDSGDSHHSVHAFEWGPAGDFYFAEGIFHHSQVESPYGLTRSANAAIYRYNPKTEHFSNFVPYTFANPWGQVFDKWGQNFIADASGGSNYIAGPFSGDVDFPHKHPGVKEFIDTQWRPTCGIEVVSTRNFPAEMQGDVIINNCIGFQGILQYRMRDTGSGFHADPVTPLLRSSDPNFRPVDLQIGPDGAVYVLDWYNPLVGHMQHSIRDPNRDKIHGRIWRITYTGQPTVEPAKIAGASLESLLDDLKTFEDRTRYRVRRELRERKTADVVAAVDTWVAKLDPADEDYERMLLEAFWVKQHHDVLDKSLLNKLLAAQQGEARAAAIRAVSHNLDRIDNSLEILGAGVNDEHPRVRLEAIRALSFFDSQEALDLTVDALLYDQDVYLDYVFKETQATLQRRIDAKSTSN